MPGGEVDDDDIVERLGKIFKDMPPYTPWSPYDKTFRQDEFDKLAAGGAAKAQMKAMKESKTSN
jgi:hypothetical protein